MSQRSKANCVTYHELAESVLQGQDGSPGEGCKGFKRELNPGSRLGEVQMRWNSHDARSCFRVREKGPCPFPDGKIHL